MYVCNTITFESLDGESSFLYILYILTEYGLNSYIKVIESRLRLQEQERAKIPIPAM